MQFQAFLLTVRAMFDFFTLPVSPLKNSEKNNFMLDDLRFNPYECLHK